MKISQVVGLCLLAVCGLLALGWVIQGNNFFLYKVFAPQYEQVRRETFEQSKSFNQGMIQELHSMMLEYAKVTPEHKSALASVILHRSADFDLNQPQVPTDLRIFIADLRKQRTNPR